MTVKEAIKEIISKSKEDKSLLKDTTRFVGFLLDLAPEHKKEITVIKRSLDSDFLALCFKDEEDIKRRVFKMKYRLENQGLGENWIDFIIDSFFSPLGWEKPIDEEPSQLQTQQIQTTDWTCSCGTVNSANFCGNCGSAKPVPKSLDWTCSCGTVNTTNFCINCGKQKGQQKQVQQPVQKQQVYPKMQKPASQHQQSTTIQQAPQPTQQQGNTFRNANVGEYIKFGNYPQTADGGILPIEWLILAREDNKMLVISRYGLETKRFDSISNDWENSKIRQWLNGDFYNKAFNEYEKKLIRHSSFFGSESNWYISFKSSILGGLLGLGDKVFLLSKEEAERYFANDNARRCKATDYAEKNGVYVCYKDYRYWWLRSSNSDDDNYDSNYVYYVSYNGDFSFYNEAISLLYDTSDSDKFAMVRPALWINL